MNEPVLKRYTDPFSVGDRKYSRGIDRYLIPTIAGSSPAWFTWITTTK